MNDRSPYRLQDTLLERLVRARHVMVLTGAGMSAESGIPTFRDAQTGMWAQKASGPSRGTHVTR